MPLYRRLIPVALITVIVIAAASQARAAPSTATKTAIRFELKRYYHADGFIKAIGRVAFRTQYNPNPVIRFKWKSKLSHLIEVRANARNRLHDLRLRLQANALPQSTPNESALLCIHRYEGSWSDSGGPYYGGLQMDLGFQATYAAAMAKHFHYPNPFTSKGTADHWTVLEQLWVAEMAINSRGFYPWPNTAHYCGLI